MKDKKFILMNLGDSRSKHIADVLSNATAKKILNYLTDNPEKSEQEISEALSMKLNTTEYNLRKLLDAGLIEKSKNFFWSKRKKRIPLYTVCNKHIVISPKTMKVNETLLKHVLPGILGILLLTFIFYVGTLVPEDEKQILSTFTSEEEMLTYIEQNTLDSGNQPFARGGVATLEASDSGAAVQGAAASNEGSDTYSNTNIQVDGVDEADIVKTDGTYIYLVSGNSVFIVRAYPAESMEIISEIDFDASEFIGDIYIDEGRLIVFTNSYNSYYKGSLDTLSQLRCPTGIEPAWCGNYGEAVTTTHIFDLTDITNPVVQDAISSTGSYITSRKIDEYVYVITSQNLYEAIVYPEIIRNGESQVLQATDISYIPSQDYHFQYSMILAIDITTGEIAEETLLASSANAVYVSQDAIYITSTQYPFYYDFPGKTESTTVTKFEIDSLDITYVGSNSVPGYVLNQFSMDEYENNFRIATTTGNTWDEERPSKNNLYVLDENLEQIGALEDLAPTERIYSVRFMGDRAYMVTFKEVDPLFVIDLEDPTNPYVLGKLKIPGYSNYLHPLDENHLIGLGKDVIETSSSNSFAAPGNVVLYQGIKMAIFDVSDVSNPIEKYSEYIGDRGTESEALYNHKAFLYDSEKELLVLPITLAEIQGTSSNEFEHGQQTFQGAYVYSVDVEEGFTLRGTVTHYSEEDVLKMGHYFWGNKNIRRALFIGDVLYTISDVILRGTDLDTLEFIEEVEIPYDGEDYYPYLEDVTIMDVAF